MLFNIKTFADLRAALYALLPIVSTLLVTYGVLDETKAALWAGVATAVLGPVIAAVQARTVSSFRTAFYALAAAVQAVVVGYGIVTDAQIGVWMPLVTALVGAAAGSVAVANTDTTPAYGRHAGGPR
ncbi:hypothetical protein [Tsukamurella tyrosinosolvens]|uniref:phage holin n=1 Tax=Tsukamurella tyrosinosolvens TaxID=57704 RepID=UPI0034637938